MTPTHFFNSISEEKTTLLVEEDMRLLEGADGKVSWL